MKASEIYFKRWAVEGACDLLKSRLQLENFSGKTEISVLQDFWANLYIANLIACDADCADEIIESNDSGKSLNNPRFADRGRVVNKFRNVFITLLLQSNHKGFDDMIADLIVDCAKFPVAKVEGRAAVRKPPRNKRFHGNRKSVT